MTEQNNAAKFAFFYMLSLVALVFVAISSGMIIFQIINKFIKDALNIYSGQFSSDELKFAISSIIISVPIFYVTTAQIHKNLFSGKMNKESQIRKWLTYLILFISSVVMIGWLIATINNFLDGDLTLKFILKAITAVGIAATIFSYYFYDIKREEVEGKKDNIIKLYFFGTLFVIIIIFTTSLFIVESPTETRNRKFDESIISKFSSIDSNINNYYIDKKVLPDSLDVLKEEFSYLRDQDFEDSNGKRFEYKVLEDKKYELCATFLTSNMNDEINKDFYYPDPRWLHESGAQCISQKIISENDAKKLQEVIR